MRYQLPTVGFAFLFSYQTASLTEERITSEGRNLTEAVEYCGFGSAVGMMWTWLISRMGSDSEVIIDQRSRTDGKGYDERTAEVI